MNNKRYLFLLTIALFFGGVFLNGCATVPARQALPRMQISQPIRTVPGGMMHQVRRGETIYRIAKNYGVSAAELMRANHIYNPRDLDTGRTLIIPGIGRSIAQVSPPLGGMALSQIETLIGAKKDVTRWNVITIHHSGTRQGSAAIFDRDHRRRRMGGLFYHFVIGNGSYTPDGLIEVGWRWKKQVKANRPNDIQICLVGNFDDQSVSDAQMDSLTKLVSLLRKQHGISLSNIRKHSGIPGKHTDCPGTRFPFSRFLQRLQELN